MTLYKASCHCGAVKYQVEGEFDYLVECNCSICSCRAHILWFVPLDSLRFECGEDHLTSYKFAKKHLNHRSCQTCSTAMFTHGDDKGVEKEQNINWSDMALRLGYYDQAHFIKDFKSLIGQSPNDYLQSLKNS